MLKHFFNAALRNIRSKPLLSFVQITGLSLGIAAFILISKYIHYEKNWDTFNENFSRIYRVQIIKKGYTSDMDQQTGNVIAKYIRDNISDVENAITVREVWGEFLSSVPEKTFYEADGMFAPSDVFSVFSFQLIEGDPKSALDNPNSIILSESTAKKYFPKKSDVIGAVIYDQMKNPLTVTGIMKDIPKNSHLCPDYFRSITQMLSQNLSWNNNSYLNYILLKQGVNPENVNKQLSSLLDEHVSLNKNKLVLYPLSEIHLDPDKSGTFKTIIYFNVFIGTLIIVLALINFMNLSISFSSIRSTEIGIRKTNGSGKRFIALQFLTESIVLSMISYAIAVAIAFLVLPYYNNIVNREITLSIINDARLFLIIMGLVIVSGILAGSYPAIIAASFNPIRVLRSKNLLMGKRKNATGMTTLVYIQFVLSALLIATSVWCYKHVDYLLTKDIGFKKDLLLHCRIDAKKSTLSYETLYQEILSNPGIEDMTVSYNTPFHNNWGTGVFYEEGPSNEYTNVRYNYACPNFINTFQIKLIEGRNFEKDISTENNKCIINKTAMTWFGWTDPIGKWINMHSKKYYVIGVVEDFHQDDVFNKIGPYLLLLHNNNLNRYNDYTFLVKQKTITGSINHIQNVLTETFPNSLFDVFTFDDDADRVDIREWSSMRDTFTFFTIIAIFIAIVGIFGLVVFATQRRIKEIGIRKVQGAKIDQVFLLITKQYIVLLLLANITISPVFNALVNFTPGAYKYHAGVGDIVIVLSITFLIVLISSGYLAYKAARKNPVEALRYE